MVVVMAMMMMVHFRRGRGRRLLEARVRDLQGGVFFLPGRVCFGCLLRGRGEGGAGAGGGTGGGRVVRGGVVVGVGLGRLRLPLRTRAGQKRRACGRLQEAFGSLRALPSYDVDVLVCGPRRQLKVARCCLHTFILRQEPSPVNQTGGHGSTEDGAAVFTDVPVAVRVYHSFSSALPRPRAFDIFICGLVGCYKVGMEAREAHNGPN